MKLLDFFASIWTELTGARDEARHIKETLAEADAKLREGFGLPPRGPEGEPVNLLPEAEAPPIANGRHKARAGR